ncbi:MAG: ribbon-helix-helix protein, CopG family [Promethearchaeia archaeon]
MKSITINLAEAYVNAIKSLTDLGIYPSRSEAVRVALSEFLQDEIKLLDELNSEVAESFFKSALRERGEN